MVNVHRKPIQSFGERYKAVGEEVALALDPSRDIDSHTIDVLKRNIGGDQSFDRWQDKMKSYHNSGATSCGKIWGSEYIAYRCRTCAFNSCMSLCAPCFEAGNHEGHDFNMFKSGAGGACDCGDTNVMCEKVQSFNADLSNKKFREFVLSMFPKLSSPRIHQLSRLNLALLLSPQLSTDFSMSSG